MSKKGSQPDKASRMSASFVGTGIGKAHQAVIRKLLISALLAAGAETAVAHDVLPGIDLWTTPAGGASTVEVALPPGFFDSGSDPFAGTLSLAGSPLPGLGGPSLFPADTVIARAALAALPACGTSATIPIEIVALSLVSTAPITVTYGSGPPELWDVRICLSDGPQIAGTMTIRHDCVDGGSFNASLPVRPKLVFTRQSDSQMRTVDTGTEDLFMTLPEGHWVHMADPSLFVISVPPGAVTDGNCDALPDPPITLGTSNFVPGIFALPCDDCDSATLEQRKRLNPEQATLAAHGVIIAQQRKTGDIDGDLIVDDADNCVDDPNPLQQDADDDSVGDICDNCPNVGNPFQEDSDGNGVGDACEGGMLLEIPTLSVWGMVAVILLLGGAGMAALLRNRGNRVG